MPTSSKWAAPRATNSEAVGRGVLSVKSWRFRSKSSPANPRSWFRNAEINPVLPTGDPVVFSWKRVPPPFCDGLRSARSRVICDESDMHQFTHDNECLCIILIDNNLAGMLAAKRSADDVPTKLSCEVPTNCNPTPRPTMKFSTSTRRLDRPDCGHSGFCSGKG